MGNKEIAEIISRIDSIERLIESTWGFNPETVRAHDLAQRELKEIRIILLSKIEE